MQQLKLATLGLITLAAIAPYSLGDRNIAIAAPLPSSSQASPACLEGSTLEQWRLIQRQHPNLPIPNLPEGYQRGCILQDEGAHSLVYSIVPDGVDPDRDPGSALRVGIDSYEYLSRTLGREHSYEHPYVSVKSNVNQIVFGEIWVESKTISNDLMLSLLRAALAQMNENRSMRE
jgi:hypothetical protein